MDHQTLVLEAPSDRNYREICYVASGSEAEVYAAIYVATGQRVALKVLTPRAVAAASRERREKRFLKEAALLRATGGQNVARVYEVLEVRLRGEVTKAFSMEWLPETFRERCMKHPSGIPVADLGRYLRDAVAGLRALHEAGVAVRDVRPENLLISSRGMLKIADLGMARTDNSGGSLVESSRYMAPEILNGTIREGLDGEDPPPEKYSASDIYALGVIFYEAAAGVEAWELLPALSSVFRAKGPGSSVDQNTRWREWHVDMGLRLPALKNVRKEIPEVLGTLLDGMVEKEPGRRPTLQDLMQGLSGNVEVAATLRADSPWQHRKWWRFGGAGAMAILMFVLGGYLAHRSPVPARPKETESFHQVEKSREVIPPEKPSLTMTSGSALEVRTTPTGAAVLVDGVFRGRAPVSLTDLSTGRTYLVRAELQGYETVSRQVVLGPAMTHMRIELSETPETTGRADPPRVQPSHLEPSDVSTGLSSPTQSGSNPQPPAHAGLSEAPRRPKLQEAIGVYLGKSGQVDQAGAQSLFLTAADTEGPVAKMWLARLLLAGDCGLIQDKARARALASSSIGSVLSQAESGDIEAMFIAGDAYRRRRDAAPKSLGVDYDDLKSLKWSLKAAEQGHALAMMIVGDAYRLGLGVAVNPAEALRWYRRAEQAELRQATRQLGSMLVERVAFPDNRAEAVRWLSAIGNPPEGMWVLAEILHEGRHIPKDDAEAVRWYQQAAEKGHKGAMNSLGMMYEQGLGVQQDDRRAVDWYRRGAEAGHSGAMVNLGSMYDRGAGIRRSRRDANKWWKIAARLGNEDAQRRLREAGVNWW